jgi:hypothetical protein
MSTRKGVVFCSVETHGSTFWISKETGEKVFRIDPHDGTKTDLRIKAPFFQILPCPHCGSNSESMSTHDPLKHTDPKLGTPSIPIFHSETGEQISW